jgi:elongation factor 1-gamma
MSYKLYTYPGNFRAFKCLIAGQYNGVDIEVPEFNMMEENKKPEFLIKSPLGKVPVLETEDGCVFESNAIARFIARVRRDTDLYGGSFFETGQIDSWMDFSANELELPATMWFYPIFGYMPFNDAATSKAKVDMKAALGVLNTHLLTRTYLVGDKISLADITVASALVYPMKMLLDEAWREEFVNVTRWFITCIEQPEFKAVIGTVSLCKTTLKAPGDNSAPAPAPAPKAAKKEEKKPEKKTKPKKKEMAFIKFALTCSPSDNFDPLFAKIKADGESKVHSLITSASYSMEPLAFGIENMMISFQFDVNGSCTGKPTAIHEVENWVDTLIGDDAGYGIQAKEQIGYDGPGL